MFNQQLGQGVLGEWRLVEESRRKVVPTQCHPTPPQPQPHSTPSPIPTPPPAPLHSHPESHYTPAPAPLHLSPTPLPAPTPLYPSSSLTAAKLITAIRTVRFLVTVEARRDAPVSGDTSELCGRTFFPRLLDGWGQNQVE